MGFLSNFFGLNKKNKKTTEETKVIETVKYNEHLIEKFKEDHLELFELFSDIVEYRERNKSYSHELVDKLEELKFGLEMHILVEDKQLYTFLREKYGEDKAHEEMINGLQKSMSKIVKEVVFFIKKYSNKESFDRNEKYFDKDLGEVGNILTKRTSMEERKLYPMYEL